jgi:hypothetical protein
LSSAVRYRHAPDLAWRGVGEETVVVDLAGGRSLGLNASGGLVWTLLPDHDDEQIATELARRYGVGLDAARVDVDRLLHALLERKLIEAV